ncbi:MAG: tRNA 2-thiouridine(34) synthase MnmA [Patescibacteria group bacterium]|jgi:tRNA-specific 2-thiouridylase
MAHERILVGLSGGVDSSVVAARLVDAGHEVVGVYLKAWDDDAAIALRGACPWRDDIADCRRIAAHLGIPFEVVDVRDAYRTRVVDALISEYAAGRTPNPDILCNREMKFGFLLDLARELGYDAVATGHYARIVDGELHRGADPKKDQTYFLWQLRSADLPMIRFPLGAETKAVIRAEAQERGLATAAKRDSQGICFLGPVDLRSFLVDALHLAPGDVVTTDGKTVGRHQGAAAYTVGQRHGLGVWGGAGETYYVVERDLRRNRLVVDTAPPTTTTLTARALNWIGASPSVGDRIEARIRHGQVPQPCTVEACNSEELELRFDEPQLAVAPGQSVVCSLGTHVLGGGLIA